MKRHTTAVKEHQRCLAKRIIPSIRIVMTSVPEGWNTPLIVTISKIQLYLLSSFLSLGARFKIDEGKEAIDLNADMGLLTRRSEVRKDGRRNREGT